MSTKDQRKPILGGYYRTSELDNPADRLGRKLAQAEALSSLMYDGQAGEEFREMCNDIQDNLGWLLNDLLVDCHLALHELNNQQRKEREAKP